MKKNILIVDNDSNVRNEIKNRFEHEGHNVVCAQNATECLTQLERGFSGILFIDLQLPQMDGWITIKEIVKRKLQRNIDIIVITATGTAHHQKMKGLEPYVYDYIAKPFDVKKLIENIEKFY
jgi:DNA-binding response OmpR family regulator